MKKLFIFTLIITSVFSNQLAAQQGFTQAIDSIYRHVSRADAKTGILYSRVLPFSGLYRFTKTDTANSEIFMQAYQELYEAAFLPTAKLPYTPDALDAMVSAKKNFIAINISI